LDHKNNKKPYCGVAGGWILDARFWQIQNTGLDGFENDHPHKTDALLSLRYYQNQASQNPESAVYAAPASR
jgi:hypothetical protein